MCVCVCVCVCVFSFLLFATRGVQNLNARTSGTTVRVYSIRAVVNSNRCLHDRAMLLELRHWREGLRHWREA